MSWVKLCRSPPGSGHSSASQCSATEHDPMSMQTQDAGAVPLTALMSILFPKEAAKEGPSPTQAQPQGLQSEPKPADTRQLPAKKASGGSSSLSEAMPSTVMQAGQQAAATGTEKRDRPQPSIAAAARDEPLSSQAAGTDPLGLLKGPSASPSNEIGPGQDNSASGKQAASAANSSDDAKEPAAPRSHAAKVLVVAKKAMPRYAPPSRPPPAASKPKMPSAPVPLGPWAAGPPAALQAAADAVPVPRLRQPPALPAATAHPHRATPGETPAVARPAAATADPATAAGVGRAGSPQSQPAAPAPQPRSRMEYRPPALSAAPSANPFPWVFGTPSTQAGSQDGAGKPQACASAHAFLASALRKACEHNGVMLQPCLVNRNGWKHLDAHTRSLHPLQAPPPARHRCQHQSHPRQGQPQLRPGGSLLRGRPLWSAGRLSTRCARCAVSSRGSTSSCRAATSAPATSAGPQQM